MSSTHADPDWKFPVTKKKERILFFWQQMFSSGRHREKKRRHPANSIRSQSDAAWRSVFIVTCQGRLPSRPSRSIFLIIIYIYLYL